MNISQLLYYVFWLYLPAMTANMAPVFAYRLNLFSSLNRPLDFGIKFRGKLLLGPHKTVRGFIVAIITGACTASIQALIAREDMLFGFLFGALLGFGAIAGDAVKSFFKRRMNIESGGLWIPFDQIDFVIGATLAGMFVIKIPLAVAIIAIIFGGIASYVVSSIGFALHFKKTL